MDTYSNTPMRYMRTCTYARIHITLTHTRARAHTLTHTHTQRTHARAHAHTHRQLVSTLSSLRLSGKPRGPSLCGCVCVCGWVCACVCVCVRVWVCRSADTPAHTHTHTGSCGQRTCRPHVTDIRCNGLIEVCRLSLEPAACPSVNPHNTPTPSVVLLTPHNTHSLDHAYRPCDRVACYPPLVHSDPSVFHDPEKFVWDRFLGKGKSVGVGVGVSVGVGVGVSMCVSLDCTHTVPSLDHTTPHHTTPHYTTPHYTTPHHTPPHAAHETHYACPDNWRRRRRLHLPPVHYAQALSLPYECPNQAQHPTPRPKPTTSDGEALAKRVLPFGGGVSMCPGRFFARREIKSFVTTCVRMFDPETKTTGLFSSTMFNEFTK